MTRTRFREVQPRILKHEGGYVNHPKDPGGATKWGITQRTYSGWLRAEGYPQASVRHMEAHEAEAIYYQMYWTPLWLSEVPLGLDYALYDYAVNSGPSRAVKELQGIVGAVRDGLMGPATISKVRNYAIKYGTANLIHELCNRRLSFMQRIRNGSLWKTFGRGWSARVADVRKHAVEDSHRGRP